MALSSLERDEALNIFGENMYSGNSNYREDIRILVFPVGNVCFVAAYRELCSILSNERAIQEQFGLHPPRAPHSPHQEA